MNKLDTENIMVRHGTSGHKLGIKCNICDDMFLNNPHVQRFIKQLEKAYGNCKNCFGKGYSTYIYGISEAADFEGDKRIDHLPYTHMVYCTCERGKQLGILIEERDRRIKEGKRFE